jgi:hypothetical protein
LDTRWLTYDELATALRISPDSARRLVARNKAWPRKPGNDGRVRIGVPAERLPPDNPHVATHDAPPDVRVDDTHDVVPDATHDVVPDATHDARADVTLTLAALEAHISTLKTDVERERERADRLERVLDEARAAGVVFQAEAAVAPALRATVEALKGALEGERSRVTELRAERDRLTVRRSWWWRRAG